MGVGDCRCGKECTGIDVAEEGSGMCYSRVEFGWKGRLSKAQFLDLEFKEDLTLAIFIT